MPRRNFVLFIIVLAVLLTGLAIFLFSERSPDQPGDEDGGFFSNLNPFGGRTQAPTYTTPGGETPGNGDIVPEIAEPGKLVKVSTMPVAGYGIFEKERTEKEFAPALRYVARETGNIYQTFADEIVERKFSNTVILKVYEAMFLNNSETVVMRMLRNDNATIQTFLGNLPKEKLGEDTINHG